MWHRFWCFFGICTHSTLKWSKIKLTLYACHTTSSHTGDGNYYFNRLRCPLQKKNTVAFAAFNWNCTSNAIKRYFNELHIQFIGFSQGIAIKASFPPLPIFFVQLKHERNSSLMYRVWDPRIKARKITFLYIYGCYITFTK